MGIVRHFYRVFLFSALFTGACNAGNSLERVNPSKAKGFDNEITEANGATDLGEWVTQQVSGQSHADISLEENINKIYTSRGAVNLYGFSTEYRPTRKLDTPWGDKEIYDPTKDRDVIQIVNYYRVPCEQGDIKACNNASKFIEFFTLFQDAELVEIGCTRFRRTNLVAYYIVPRGQNPGAPPYPEGYYNPFANYDYTSSYFRPKMDNTANSEFIVVNGRRFTKTKLSMLTGTFFSSESLNLEEVFEFECKKW